MERRVPAGAPAGALAWRGTHLRRARDVENYLLVVGVEEAQGELLLKRRPQDLRREEQARLGLGKGRLIPSGALGRGAHLDGEVARVDVHVADGERSVGVRSPVKQQGLAGIDTRPDLGEISCTEVRSLQQIIECMDAAE